MRRSTQTPFLYRNLTAAFRSFGTLAAVSAVMTYFPGSISHPDDHSVLRKKNRCIGTQNRRECLCPLTVPCSYVTVSLWNDLPGYALLSSKSEERNMNLSYCRGGLLLPAEKSRIAELCASTTLLHTFSRFRYPKNTELTKNVYII